MTASRPPRRPALVRPLAGALALALGAAPALALPASPPLPPSRPAMPEAAARPPAPPLVAPDRPVQGPPMPDRPPPPVTPAAPPAPDLAEELVCARLFSSNKVVARAIAPVGTREGCRMAAPIELSAIVVAPGRRIGLEPPVSVSCGLGGVVADWVREDLVPLFDKAGRPLVALSSTSGYACRERNRVPGAKLSEHGLGEALDIGGFVPERGGPVGVRDGDPALMGALKATACARFATVLGPGSDGFHETHLHVDVEQRRNGGKICHWDLP